MPILDWLFGLGRKQITHSNNSQVLPSIANDTDYYSDGYGLHFVNGDVGHGVKLQVTGDSSLVIRGRVGSDCSIFKDGRGHLVIQGDVADNLKIVAYGQGTITFNQRPPQSVINAIQRRSVNVAITCGGELILPVTPYYRHHNQGHGVQASVASASAPAQSANIVMDTLPVATQVYVKAFKERMRKTPAELITALNLTKEEEPLFIKYIDCLTTDYMDDVPVTFNENYYNMSTVEILCKKNAPDPLTRFPMKLANIGPAREFLNRLDKDIEELHKQRQQALNEKQNKLAEEPQSVLRP